MKKLFNILEQMFHFQLFSPVSADLIDRTGQATQDAYGENNRPSLRSMGERCQHRNVRNPSFSGCYEPQTREYPSLQIIFHMMMTEESPPGTNTDRTVARHGESKRDEGSVYGLAQDSARADCPISRAVATSASLKSPSNGDPQRHAREGAYLLASTAST